jgi:hypothetical protein
MDKTIEMAREVKATAYTNRHYPDRTTYTFGPEQLKAFADLVRADEREEFQRWFDAVTAQHKQLILAEREACAELVYNSPPSDEYESPLKAVYDAIRDRGNT